ncbi:hypothetical protein CDAR_268151 [Caerostris darwini]|uniref:Uncharacterized protein n=1 Tax=Caerostris darwini TaxID=1538125 RepID=A0AAV4VPW6_9ARAC|nr:hypothetical protein CDAR_268151 [Caerostris darwini]
MKPDHGDSNDDCESQCRDASGAFLLSCCRNYTSRIVKIREEDRIEEVILNYRQMKRRCLHYGEAGNKRIVKKGRMIINMIENNYFHKANDVCFRRWDVV